VHSLGRRPQLLLAAESGNPHSVPSALVISLFSVSIGCLLVMLILLLVGSVGGHERRLSALRGDAQLRAAGRRLGKRRASAGLTSSTADPSPAELLLWAKLGRWSWHVLATIVMGLVSLITLLTAALLSARPSPGLAPALTLGPIVGTLLFLAVALPGITYAHYKSPRLTCAQSVANVLSAVAKAREPATDDRHITELIGAASRLAALLPKTAVRLYLPYSLTDLTESAVARLGRWSVSLSAAIVAFDADPREPARAEEIGRLAYAVLGELVWQRRPVLDPAPATPGLARSLDKRERRLSRLVNAGPLLLGGTMLALGYLLHLIGTHQQLSMSHGLVVISHVMPLVALGISAVRIGMLAWRRLNGDVGTDQVLAGVHDLTTETAGVAKDESASAAPAR